MRDTQNKQHNINKIDNVLTDEIGAQFYSIGTNRIKISEHFSESGKTMDNLILEFLEYKMNVT